MRRFRFVGNPNRYFYFNPVKGLVYDEDAINGNRTILQTSKTYPEDWQEVFEEPAKPLHKDTDLGYFAGLIFSSLYSIEDLNFNYKIECSIMAAKQLIKQLDEQSK